jgi:uncharacterized protein
MADVENPTIDLVVVYAKPRQAVLLEVRVPAGSSVRHAIQASGILDCVPELAGRELDVGIFGQSCRLDDAVHNADRVEIYRSLTIDPKEGRRRRAALKTR